VIVNKPGLDYVRGKERRLSDGGDIYFLERRRRGCKGREDRLNGDVEERDYS